MFKDLSLFLFILVISTSSTASIYKLVGEDIQVVCNGKGNSSQYIFNLTDTETKHTKTYEQPSENIQIINENQAVLTIRNASEQSKKYQCIYNGQMLHSVNVYVYTLPKEVLDLKCRIYGFAKGFCNFTAPKSAVKTLYYVRSVSAFVTINNEPRRIDERGNYGFNISITSPSLEYFDLLVTGYNKIPVTKNNITSKQFRINVLQNSIPEAKNFNIRTIESKQILITWEETYKFKHNTTRQLEVTPENMNTVTINLPECISDNNYCEEYINLNYSYYKHFIRLKLKWLESRDDIDMWWRSETKVIQTLPSPPGKSPETNPNSFEIKQYQKKVVLFWKALQPFEQNGPNFTYLIEQNGIPITTTQEISIELDIPQNDAIYNFYIKSKNDLGISTTGSLIKVNTLEENSKLKPTNVISSYAGVIHNLTWTSPEQLDGLNNFTVFYFNEENFDYEDVPKDITSYKLISNKNRIKLGVAANYDNYSSGIHWNQCDDSVEKGLNKPGDLEVSNSNSNSLTLVWNPKVFCESIIANYSLTYKDLLSQSKEQVLHFNRFEKETTISNLTPCTKYQIDLKMFSHIDSITTSIIAMTRGSEPSAPEHLIVHDMNTTSDSTFISWKAGPTVSCPVTGYEIHLRAAGNCSVVETIDVKQTTNLSHRIRNLCSSTNYTVAVVAKHYEFSSPPSNSKSFETLIGRPLKPTNLKYTNNLFNWSIPVRKSGPKLYYIVDLMETLDDVKSLKYRSIVEDNLCYIIRNSCDLSGNYNLRVSAMVISDKIDQKLTNTNEKLEVDMENTLCDNSLKNLEVIPSMDYIISDWEESIEIPYCRINSRISTIKIVALVFISFAIVSSCCFLMYSVKKKIQKMQSIGIKIPDGLIYGDTPHDQDDKLSKKLNRSDSETLDTHSIDSTEPLDIQENSSLKLGSPQIKAKMKSLQNGYVPTSFQNLNNLDPINPNDILFKEFFGESCQDPIQDLDIMDKSNEGVGKLSTDYVSVNEVNGLKLPQLPNPPIINTMMNINNERKPTSDNIRNNENKEPPLPQNGEYCPSSRFNNNNNNTNHSIYYNDIGGYVTQKQLLAVGKNM